MYVITQKLFIIEDVSMFITFQNIFYRFSHKYKNILSTFLRYARAVLF